jgi:hypothetical protein
MQSKLIIVGMSTHNNNIKNSTAWSKRFIAAAMIHASIVALLTIFLVSSQVSLLTPAVSRVIAAGGAGTWFTIGYTMYIIVGVVSMSAYGLFYYYVENASKQSYGHAAPQLLAWGNFVLLNSGTIATMSMLMYGGYSAGAAMLPVDVGGKGYSAAQAHTILGPLAEPIAIAVLVTAIGALLGILGFAASHLTSRRELLTIEGREKRREDNNTNTSEI